MHDGFVLLKRERDLNDKERLLLDGWTKNYSELGAGYRLKEGFYGIYMRGPVTRRPLSLPTRLGPRLWFRRCAMPTLT